MIELNETIPYLPKGQNGNAEKLEIQPKNQNKKKETQNNKHESVDLNDFIGLN